MSTGTRLKFLADVQVSSVDKKSAEGEVPVRLCNYTDVYYRDRITADVPFMEATAPATQVEKFRLQVGQTLITKDSETAGDIGVPAYVEFEAPDLVCGYHLAQITPTAALDSRFLFWFLSADRTRSAQSVGASGVTRFGLRTETINNLRLNPPVLDNQRRIASFLDKETDRIDRLITTKVRMVDVVLERLGVQRDRLIWGESERVALRVLVDPDRPIMYGIVLPGPNIEDEPRRPIVKGGDVGAHFTRALKATTPEIEAPYARARLRGNDVVLTIRGGIGEVALVPEWADGANITQDVARIAPAVHVEPQWLLHMMSAPAFQSMAEAYRTGATITGLNIFDVQRMPVPIQDRKTQRRVCGALNDLADHCAELAVVLRSQVELLRERRRALITAAVTGEMEVP